MREITAGRRDGLPWHYGEARLQSQSEFFDIRGEKEEGTSEPRPQPVVVAVQEPVQDPGEDGAVVVGRRLLLGLRGRLAEAEGYGQRGE